MPVSPTPGNYTIRKVCDRCGGTGQITLYPAKWFDVDGNPVTTTTATCPICAGVGKVAWGDMVAG